MKIYTEAADIIEGIYSFTRRLQSIVQSKVRARGIINPNILQ